MEADLLKIKRTIVLRVFLFSVIFILLVFAPAGSLAFWEAWIVFFIFLGSSIFLSIYLFRTNPELLERRLRKKETIKEQKLIQRVNTIVFIVGFLISGLDHRFNLSHVPLNIVLLSDVMVLLGYVIIFIVLTENTYASATIIVEKNQKVVSTGLYAVIRHPMYLGAMIMLLFTPVALGSLWALIPFMIMPFMILLRLLNEEKTLMKELAGYEAYCKKVRYRLIPFIW